MGASRPAESAQTIIFVVFQRFSVLEDKLDTKPLLRALCSSQERFWNGFGVRLPKIEILSQVRTNTIQATWGPTRKMRCSEIVIGFINDPCTFDPFFVVFLVFAYLRPQLIRKTPGKEAISRSS